MKSAVITSGDHWITIDTIAYLRGSITPIEPVTYKDGREGVKISSSVKELVIDVEGTTIDGDSVGSQTELITFLRDFAYSGSAGSGGIDQQTIISSSSYNSMISNLPMDKNVLFLVAVDENKNIENTTYAYFHQRNILMWVASTEEQI